MEQEERQRQRRLEKGRALHAVAERKGRTEQNERNPDKQSERGK